MYSYFDVVKRDGESVSAGVWQEITLRLSFVNERGKLPLICKTWQLVAYRLQGSAK